MPEHCDVVVARIMEAGISFEVDGELDYAVPAAKGVEVGGRIEMVVNVD
jgi:hypothetical protein